MTALTSGGAYSGGGTGSDIDAPLGNFSSLQALFSQQPSIYASPQPGLPASEF